MNSIMKTLVAATFVSLPIFVVAQTENPRGIYKMTTLTGKTGEVKAPYEQYKICTDSVTLMVNEMKEGTFMISVNDSKVFNYTGEHPKTENDKSTLIYDSNEKQFRMKWWSSFSNHIYFPNGDWCIEKYESGQYSEKGKAFFDALAGVVEVDKNNPIIGTWRVVAHVDELRDVKTVLPIIQKKNTESINSNKYYVFTHKNWVALDDSRGAVYEVSYDGKKSYMTNNKTFQVKRLSKDRIAVEDSNREYHTDWFVLERVTNGNAPLNQIASYYLEILRRAGRLAVLREEL